MNIIKLLIFLPLGILGQEYDVYRIKAVQNQDTSIVSISNTIRIPKSQLIYIPNVFSPDGDGVNDLFYAKGQNIGHLTLHIYNRWGQLVFKDLTLGERWNGTYKGQDCPIGTYVYQLLWDKKVTHSGTVALIR